MEYFRKIDFGEDILSEVHYQLGVGLMWRLGSQMLGCLNFEQALAGPH